MKGSIDHVMTDLATPLFGEEYKLSGSSSYSFLQLSCHSSLLGPNMSFTSCCHLNLCYSIMMGN